jgi:hypothetical protein
MEVRYDALLVTFKASTAPSIAAQFRVIQYPENEIES